MERVLKGLEYNKIIDQLKQHAVSSLGLERIEALQPSKDIKEIKHWQDGTDEGAKVIRLKGTVPLGGIFNIRASLKRSEIGGVLNASELLEIGSTIYGGRRIKTFIEKMLEDEIELPVLTTLISQISLETELEREIKHCIDDQGVMLDGASDQLRSIRTQLRTFERKVRENLEGITRSHQKQKMLSDAIITIRNDRYVIPVKQEYRGSFGGIVHDQSASGQTLFVEPASVVDMNNQLREAKGNEKQEIERILTNLTVKTAERIEPLGHNVTILKEIDFIFAKALYARKLKASKPSLNTEGYVSAKKARHPLIPEDEVVPIDIELGKVYELLIITGPNTGGKTVALKTVGLLTLMAQSGLQIPVQDGAKMAVFQSVFADIGDEQSIEQNLSTFSSHMTNIIDILKHLDHESLVLFDELGAGTDPQEGAALAISILDHVHKIGARVIATTHYSELKAYAYEREGVLNASVEFDVETLSPTYRLLIGVPGRSNAFEISRRLGMEETLIDAAKGQMSSDTNKVDKMIASLETSQRQAEADRHEASEILKETNELRTDLETKITKLENDRERVLGKTERKAKEAVKKAKRKAEAIIDELRELQKQHGNVKDHQLIDAKKRLEEAEPSFQSSTNQSAQKRPQKRTYKKDEEVKVLSLDQKGHIVEKIDEKEYLVQVGIMKINVKAADLQPVKAKKLNDVRPIVSIHGNDSHVKTELDLRGKRYEEAMAEVEKFLDDALLAGYSQVSVIHGKGTGALRKGVSQLLKNHRHVKGSRMGEAGEGGTGMTVVQLK